MLAWEKFCSGSSIPISNAEDRKQQWLYEFCHFEDDRYPTYIKYDERIMKLLYLS